ncbi:hypothetical protein [Rhizobium sp. L1K21]|uniref:hypothetical protein n=1 Tax=Rhizobium sp. L1K21 TaxID=2954933 RepID=UPI002094006E|nr:hypothetical protein [Rhizobium sp. L1K21]MCO6186299.1 hypothetical protein [Rhizobium sp. L1K21]
MTVPALAQQISEDGLSAIERIAPSQNTLSSVEVEAHLQEGAPPLQEGLAWRVFSAIPGEDGKLPLVASAEGGVSVFQLPPGEYFINAAFGRAAATKKLRIWEGAPVARQSLVLDAGGLLLHAETGDDMPIPDSDLTFSIYASAPSGDSERVLVAKDIRPDTVVRLNADTYHVVSQYGHVNAVVQADMQVSAGKITEATLEHRAARVTFKLVANAGGEAIADTAWSILTASGDLLATNVGAFPSMVLAEGNYTAIARNKEKIYQKDFEVTAGRNSDVEVLLADGAQVED